jgi:hypothetical protein
MSRTRAGPDIEEEACTRTISQAIAEAYAADWIREAEARSRARIALEDGCRI